MKIKNEKLSGTLVMLLATILWGSSFVVTKGTVDDIPLFMLIAVRMLIGSLSIALIYSRHIKEINRKVLLQGMLLGVLYCGGMLMQTVGIKKTSAGRSAFLTSAYCVLMPYLEWIFMKHKPELKNLAAAVCGIAGVGLVALTESFTIDSGDLYTLLGSICFAMVIILLGVFILKSDSTLLNAILLFTAGVTSGVISLFTETVPQNIGSSAIFGLLYLSVACTGVPLLLQSFAQKRVSPTLISIILGFEAVVASVLSVIIFKETFTVRCLVGFALILLSIFIGEIDTKKSTERV